MLAQYRADLPAHRHERQHSCQVHSATGGQATHFLSVTACGSEEQGLKNIEPEVSQMKAICELAVMDCYYHNVAKFEEEDAEGFLFWQKDKHFWIEYSGVVTLGIDVSQVEVEVTDTQVTITMPPAEVQSCRVDSSSLTEDSFIVADGSASIDA